MEIKNEHKIGLDGFSEQDRPYRCPECCEELDVSNIIGFGEYPQGGFRSSMKPNATFGVGFECPKCFCKSCFHGTNSVYQLFLDFHRF